MCFQPGSAFSNRPERTLQDMTPLLPDLAARSESPFTAGATLP